MSYEPATSNIRQLLVAHGSKLNAMYIKIYFNDKPLFLCDDMDETIQPYIHHDDAIFIDKLDPHAVKSMIHEMQQLQVHAGVYFHHNLDELKKAFWKKFTIVKAAGGYVQNEKDEVLMIFRRGKWDLPKGKLDKGEKLEECAIREVEEETGLKKVKIVSALTTTYHTYHEGSRFILKESYWYRMKAKSDELLIPQQEESISAIQWVNDSEMKKCLLNSFPSIIDVVKLAKTH